jgi:putative tricarboxylic transport membrane protein
MITGRSLRIGEAALGGGVLALGLFIAFETTRGLGPTSGVVGPALFPYLIAAGLVIVGASLLREAFAGHIAHEGGFELDWIAVALVSAGLLIQMFLLETLGWIPATTLLFIAVARAFGSRRFVIDAALGIAITAASFIVFNYGLGLNLPGGVVADLIAPAEPETTE